jgi:hypothetical protein
MCTEAWGTAKRITAALRCALCGAPLATPLPVPSAPDLTQQELVAAGLLSASGSMLSAAAGLLTADPESEGGGHGITHRCAYYARLGGQAWAPTL